MSFASCFDILVRAGLEMDPGRIMEKLGGTIEPRDDRLGEVRER